MKKYFMYANDIGDARFLQNDLPCIHINDSSIPKLVNVGYLEITVPVKKVKKWQWVMKFGNNQYGMTLKRYTTKESAERDVDGVLTIIEPFLPSEIEE